MGRWNEMPEERYAREHPGCSLDDYCKYLNEIKKAEEDRKRQEKEEHDKLLQSFIGKAFRVKFNGESFGYFKITEDIVTSLEHCFHEDFYSVFIKGSKIFSIGFENKRIINKSWLPGQQYAICELIPDEIFDKIVEYYEELQITANKIRDMEL